MRRVLHPSALEPRQSAVIGVILGHLALIALGGWWAKGGVAGGVDWDVQRVPGEAVPVLKWRHPGRFRVGALPPTAGEAVPVSVGAGNPVVVRMEAEDGGEIARYITLSRRNIQPIWESQRDRAVPSASASAAVGDPQLELDQDLYVELDRIDEAVYQAFMQVWQPPAGKGLAREKRAARLDLSLSYAMEIEEAELVTPSGWPEFDLSILNAVDEVKQLLTALKKGRHAIKIPQSLPSTFRNLRYDCRIQFQIE
jgi:hypothetical protein